MSVQGAVALALVTLVEYRQRHQRFFPSDGSLQWYLRQHRAKLIDAGALLLITGRYHVDVDRFNDYVLKAGSEAARRQIEAA